MTYVSEEQYNYIRNNRDIIDGCLNRIAVTDEPAEIEQQIETLKYYIEQYAERNRERIRGEFKPEPIHSIPDNGLDF